MVGCWTVCVGTVRETGGGSTLLDGDGSVAVAGAGRRTGALGANFFPDLSDIYQFLVDLLAV